MNLLVGANEVSDMVDFLINIYNWHHTACPKVEDMGVPFVNLGLF